MSTQIPLSLTPEEPVSIEVISRLPNMEAARKLCVQVSGRCDKAVYRDLDIDAPTWSRINAGTAYFPPNKLNALMDACGNEIPLRWLAWSRNKGVHLLESEQQRIMREKDDRIRDLEMRERVLLEAIRGK